MGTRLGPKSTPGGIGRDPGTISISGFKAAFFEKYFGIGNLCRQKFIGGLVKFLTYTYSKFDEKYIFHRV
jgi:hypothetical protein